MDKLDSVARYLFIITIVGLSYTLFGEKYDSLPIVGNLPGNEVVINVLIFIGLYFGLQILNPSRFLYEEVYKKLLDKDVGRKTRIFGYVVFIFVSVILFLYSILLLS